MIPKPDCFAIFPLASPHVLSGFFDLLQDGESARVEEAAGFGRLHAAGMAHEQSDAQVLFELPDLHAKRGLRDVQLLCRARHIAGLDHADEIFELTQVHSQD